jgi:hypothetical protein
LVAGSWKLEAGSWKLETYNLQLLSTRILPGAIPGAANDCPATICGT